MGRGSSCRYALSAVTGSDTKILHGHQDSADQKCRTHAERACLDRSDHTDQTNEREGNKSNLYVTKSTAFQNGTQKQTEHFKDLMESVFTFRGFGEKSLVNSAIGIKHIVFIKIFVHSNLRKFRFWKSYVHIIARQNRFVNRFFPKKEKYFSKTPLQIEKM
ncbi:MAG: hypothetical protein E7629_08005 [Ruminococcaceae bacterium]|nr:hypothetical protein [Oscillospiraceae bacterium]